jgi:hypothetical protein
MELKEKRHRVLPIAGSDMKPLTSKRDVSWSELTSLDMVVEWLTILLCIREVRGSNIGLETSYLL